MNPAYPHWDKNPTPPVEDPTQSYWLRGLIESGDYRDVCDVLNDLADATDHFNAKLRAVCPEFEETPPPSPLEDRGTVEDFINHAEDAS